MNNEKYYTIYELIGDALEKALTDTREAEFDDIDAITREDLIDYNRMTGAVYESNGEFVDYDIRFYNIAK